MMALQKVHHHCYASAFVTQCTFVRIVPQALRASMVKLFSSPSESVFFFTNKDKNETHVKNQTKLFDYKK